MMIRPRFRQAVIGFIGVFLIFGLGLAPGLASAVDIDDILLGQANQVGSVRVQADRAAPTESGQAEAIDRTTEDVLFSLTHGTNQYVERQAGSARMSLSVDAAALDPLSASPEVAAITPAMMPAAMRRLAAGGSHSLALKPDGSLWAWGYHDFGRTGISSSPVLVASGVDAVSAGSHSLAIMRDRSLRAWGNNSFGQIGDGTLDARSMLVRIMTPVTAMVASINNSFAVKPDGSLWGWGVLGDDIGDKTTTPVRFSDRVSPAVDVAAGYRHLVELRQDESVWTSGENDAGQLGNGTTRGDYGGSQVLSGVAAVAAGDDHAAALKVDGSLWTWGDNTHGQIGDGTTRNRLKPFRVMTGVVALAAGGSVTLALKTDATLWAWGYNWEGGLGDGTTQNRTRPIRVMAGVVAMATGGFHTLARTNDGTLWSWGSNGWGQLGDGTRTDRLTPVRVIGFGPTDSVPRAPSSLVARTVSAARIDLRWADNSSDEQGFRVERRHGTDNWTEIATLGANATNYANSGLRSGTTYSYRISAYNASGSSGYSNTATASTSGTLPCDGGQIPIKIGATVAGRLSTTDCFADLTRPGHYRDNYVFQAIAGRTYSIELSSSTFDTYLNLLATGATILASDNDGGGGTNSRIVYRATSTRTLRIQATSNFPGTAGTYVLSLR